MKIFARALCARLVESGGVPTDDEAGAAQRTVGHQRLAVVPSGHTAHDGQSQSRSPGAARAALVEPDEGIENPLTIRRRHAGSVVIHRQHVSQWLWTGQSNLNVSAGMPDGILQQVQQRARHAR